MAVHVQMTMLEDLNRAAWARTSPVSGQQGNSWEFRKDILDNLVRFADYGNRHSPFGWELESVGSYSPDNVQALHWRTIAARSENLPAGLLSRTNAVAA